jgi:exopolyphosphatase/pppGpp-phosphohydrolase
MKYPIGSLILLLTLTAASGGATSQTRRPICAIDMGSNTFRRIVGSFEAGRYSQASIERRTLGVGDDVTRHGRISEAKLKEIEQTLSSFKSSCAKEGAAPVVAIGTAAFRDAPNGRTVIQIAKKLDIGMEIATERRESELAYVVGSLGRDGYAVIDNGSRSIELVAKENGELRYAVFDLGYRLAYDSFFAGASDPAAAVQAFRARLKEEGAKASFMKGKEAVVGVEFGEMSGGLFDQAGVEGRVFTLNALRQKLGEITTSGTAGFQALKKTKDIDRALPRLVVAVTLLEAFGYSQIELTDRELGTGLIIEAGMKKP